MAKNFLQLVQDLHREVGAAGVAPTSVVNQTGESARLVNWILQADEFVKDLYENWKFKRREFSQTATPSIATIAAPANIGFWDFDTFKIRPVGFAVGEEYPIEAVEYEQVKGAILDVSENIPDRVIVMPDNSLKCEPVPDDAHRFLADYYVTSEDGVMVNNTDQSIIPPQYRKVILGRAIMLYGNYEDAPEAKRQGAEIYSEFLQRLEGNQLPNQKHSRFRTGSRIEVVGGQDGGDFSY